MKNPGFFARRSHVAWLACAFGAVAQCACENDRSGLVLVKARRYPAGAKGRKIRNFSLQHLRQNDERAWW